MIMNDNDDNDNDNETNAYRVPYLPVDSPMAITPTNFRIQLYNHQRRTLYRLLQIEATGIQTFCFGGHYSIEYETKGGCICDAVGLGKTATILALICSEQKNYNLGGNIFVMAPHLIAQWTNECKKFIQDNEVDVLSFNQYRNTPNNQISNRTIVLCTVDEVLQSRNYHYDWRKLYDNGIRVHHSNSEYDKAFIQRCRKQACFVSGIFIIITIITIIIIIIIIINIVIIVIIIIIIINMIIIIIIIKQEDIVGQSGLMLFICQENLIEEYFSKRYKIL